MPASIEVFQDLTIASSTSQMAALGKSLIARAKAPWRHQAEEVSEPQEHGTVLFMEREEDGALPAARLLLWPSETGYSVMNVVPLKVGQLDRATYNALLQEFTQLIALPAAASHELSAKLSRQWQSLDEWFSPSTAQALSSFSNSANKSTGASHPRDQERWMNFLISAHNDRSEIDSDLLYRWLHEVERWQEDEARDLLMDYDFARALLAHYDQHR